MVDQVAEVAHDHLTAYVANLALVIVQISKAGGRIGGLASLLFAPFVLLWLVDLAEEAPCRTLSPYRSCCSISPTPIVPCAMRSTWRVLIMVLENEI